MHAKYASAPTHDLLSRISAPKGETIFDIPPGDYSFTVEPANSVGRPAPT